MITALLPKKKTEIKNNMLFVGFRFRPKEFHWEFKCWGREIFILYVVESESRYN
jgi:hypothetical protein